MKAPSSIPPEPQSSSKSFNKAVIQPNEGTKYWIGVASKQHVMRGMGLGIGQIGHGRRNGLARMKYSDFIRLLARSCG